MGLLIPKDSRSKDPCTSNTFNSTYVLRSLYHSCPTCAMIANTIVKRIGGITVAEIDQFLPDLDDQNTNSNNFVSQIIAMATLRSKPHEIYCRQISTLQNAATMYSTPLATRHPPPPPSISTSTSTTFMRHFLPPQQIQKGLQRPLMVKEMI